MLANTRNENNEVATTGIDIEPTLGFVGAWLINAKVDEDAADHLKRCCTSRWLLNITDVANRPNSSRCW
jgi:hypothetical protein